MENKGSKMGLLEHKSDGKSRRLEHKSTDLSRVENGVPDAKLASDKKIPEYIVAGKLSKGRIIMMESSVSKKYRFCQTVAGKLEVIIFSDINGTCYGSAKGRISVFKKLHPSAFHREFMRLNAKAHWLGETIDEEKIIQNTMELLEII